MTECIFQIFRGTKGAQYWEAFPVKLTEGMNVISGLMQIRNHPVNLQGKKSTPVAWEEGCLEEVCGSCSMLINGKPRQSCTAIVANCLRDSGSSQLILAPFTKFPLIRDLYVDRTQMFEALKRVKAWIPVEGTCDTKEYGPKISPEVQEALYLLSTCMTCGCCAEACPEVYPESPFMGPAVMSQVRLFNAHPQGALIQGERLREVMGEGGIGGCGNAQNCARVCPKKIPLTESIAVIGRAATQQALRDFFSVPDQGS